MSKKKEKVSKDVVITGIVAITLLELMAMYKGFDGILLTTVIGILALAIGITLPQLKIK